MFEENRILNQMQNTYPYNKAAPAIPPPHCAVIYMAARNGEIALITAIPSVIEGLMWAPKKNGFSFIRNRYSRQW